MDNKLLKYFLKIRSLSEDEIKAIDETMTIQHYKKGTALLKEGQSSAAVYFVLEGMVRQYYLVDGKEKTSDFFSEEQWVLSINSLTHRIPSNHYLECCMDCKLVVGNSQKGEYIYKKFPKLETISRKLMERVITEQQEKMEAYIIDTPKLRYLKLLKYRPDLFQRIPQYQVASYIGVTPESLSRIRKRISQKTNS